jgi:hypothetical protein
MSWVTNIAKKPKTGLILLLISLDFFKIDYLYVNNL